MSVSQPLWTPSPERIAASRMRQFMAWAEDRTGHSFPDWESLYQWSVTDIEEFWESLWHFSGILHSRSYDRVLDKRIMPGARWFEGARLNFARNLLRYRDNHPAIVHWREQGPPVRLTYAEIYEEVARCAAGMARLDTGIGDRVAAYIPNIPQAVIAMLAATSRGALWSSCSPDFGLQGVVDRFGQITPKLLVTVSEYTYQGKTYDLRPRIHELRQRIPSLEQIIFADLDSSDGDPNGISWQELLADSSRPLTFEELPFDHPVYIMYSSGTTGVPKCIVHGAGGTLLQHFKEHVLHTDLQRSDVLSYFTTCGWMMWNWLVSGLQTGATIFLYDGSPASPDLGVLWRAIEQERITVFGTSPKYLTTCQHAGIVPRQSHDLTSLRTMLSTGSPLTAENYAWVYRDVEPDVQLASISGGTDIISCFMLGNPLLPVHAEEIQSRGLGMKVEAWDDNGKPLMNETGELVCPAPFPSMPVGFWNDPDGKAYRAAYFEHFPGVWRHGDFIRITGRGSVIVYGRSDATLNPGGVRIGTAEIYNPVEALDEVADSLVIGQAWQNDVRIILFVVLHDGVALTESLKSRIRETIRTHNTPRHLPAKIIEVREIPRTLNGKKVELAVWRVIHGQPVDNRESLINPDSLHQFENLPELAE